MRRAVFLCGVLLLFVGVAMTAANVVSSSRAGEATATVDANALKPAACAALNLTSITLGAGGGGNSLILGTPGKDNLNGGAGDDCIVGGAGDDRIKGKAGIDVCIGGPGNDSFDATCETQIQG